MAGIPERDKTVLKDGHNPLYWEGLHRKDRPDRKRKVFQAFCNSLQQKIKFETENGLMGMYDEAIQAVRNCLNSDNESIKLKAAIWLIEEIKSKSIGETDPRILIKGICMENSLDFDFGIHLNEIKFKKLLMENNLK